MPRWDQIAVGWDLLAVLPAASRWRGSLLSGSFPSGRARAARTWDALRTGSVQGGRAEGTVSRLILVGAQIALTVVLAFGCVQLLRSAARLGQRRSRLRSERARRCACRTTSAEHPSNGARAALYQRIRDRVSRCPASTAVGVVTHIPLSGSDDDGRLRDGPVEGAVVRAVRELPGGHARVLRQRCGFRSCRGATSRTSKTRKSQPVDHRRRDAGASGVSGRSRTCIGRTLRLGWGLPNSQIVGVVGHARTIEIGRVVRPQIYAPIGNLFQNAGIVTVRASGDPRVLDAGDRRGDQRGRARPRGRGHPHAARTTSRWPTSALRRGDRPGVVPVDLCRACSRRLGCIS